MIKPFWLLLFLLLPWPGQAADGMMRFVYPPAESRHDVRHQYFWRLLDAVLDASRDRYGDYLLEAYPGNLPFLRALAEVARDDGLVNIIVRTTNPTLENTLRPVYLPLDKGLAGFRLFLVMPDTAQALSTVQTSEALKAFSIGLGSNWGDIPVLRSAGFNKLSMSDNYSALFNMLGAGRFQLLTRAASEIGPEYQVFHSQVPGMLIEPNIALHYPLAYIYYLPPTARGTLMAERLEYGLQKLQQSGEFERRYRAYKAYVLKDVKIAGRRVFKIENPLLSTAMPARSNAAWWDTLGTETGSRRN